MKPSLASLYQAVELRQEIPPLIIGERANANGSKAFRERLLAEDFQGCLEIGLAQEAAGAHVLDLCAAYAGRDEAADMIELVTLFARAIKIPIMIDSTSPECVEECLKIYPGRAVINSIHLEDEGTNLRKVCALSRTYGAAVVALTIHEKGMAMTSEEKVETAVRIHEIAVNECGLRSEDILFDPLTFTIGSGDKTLKDAAIQTLDALTAIKQRLPEVFTILGVSNISFGLSPSSRRVLNAVFLHKAVEAGLDAAIIDAAKLIPLSSIPEEERRVALDLIYNLGGSKEESPLTVFINHFTDHKSTEESEEPANLATEEALARQIKSGKKDGVEDILVILLERFRPAQIINLILVPAMRLVGELFGRGEMLLPFVLQSAEVMKLAVAFLEPLMEKRESETRTSVLLATVQGDVHDIGKNLVEIILANNGYRVFNLGIKVPAGVIIEKAREHKVDIIGLSGLLVKSALIMKDNLASFAQAGLEMPVLLGGAALTPNYVAESCVPAYAPPVVYCRDAFAGLKAVREAEEGTLISTVALPRVATTSTAEVAPEVELTYDYPAPHAPIPGVQYSEDIQIDRVLPYMNKQALYRGRWGYRRGKMSADEYRELIRGTVDPLYNDLLDRCRENNWLQPKAACGYFACHADGNALHLTGEEGEQTFTFPRQSMPPHRCISDFFRASENGGDEVALFVVTLGSAVGEAIKELYEADRYHDYLMLHGLSVEITDAIAEYQHAVIRHEWGIGDHDPTTVAGYAEQQYQGSRYGFGYPACPDLDAQKQVFALLKPETIGVTLTESMEMVPEQSTSAIVAHHPDAKYFAV